MDNKLYCIFCSKTILIKSGVLATKSSSSSELSEHEICESTSDVEDTDTTITKQVTKFLRIINRYIQPPTQEKFRLRVNNKLVKQISSVVCLQCRDILKSVIPLYRELECLQMKINWNLETLRNILNSYNYDVVHAVMYQKALFQSEEGDKPKLLFSRDELVTLKKFRMKLSIKCTEHLIKMMPDNCIFPSNNKVKGDCFSEIQNGNEQQIGDQTDTTKEVEQFFKIINRYFADTTNINIKFDKEIVEIVSRLLCLRCRIIFNSTSQLYPKLESLQMKINWKLGTLLKLIENPEPKWPIRVQFNQWGRQICRTPFPQIELNDLNKFRTRFRDKCSMHLNGLFPKISLVRCEENVTKYGDDTGDYLVPYRPVMGEIDNLDDDAFGDDHVSPAESHDGDETSDTEATVLQQIMEVDEKVIQKPTYEDPKIQQSSILTLETKIEAVGEANDNLGTIKNMKTDVSMTTETFRRRKRRCQVNSENDDDELSEPVCEPSRAFCLSLLPPPSAPPRKFVSEEVRLARKKAKNTSNKLLCDHCPKTLCNEHSRMIHMKTQHSTEAGTINKGNKIITEDGITISDWIAKVGARFQCPVVNCGIMFMTQDGLNDHTKLHGTFPCNFCTKVFPFASDLPLHELSEHSNGDDKNKLCPRCPYQLYAVPRRHETNVAKYVDHHLHVHMKLLVDGVRCPICKVVFMVSNRKHGLRRTIFIHYLTYHDVTSDKTIDDKVHRCEQPSCVAYFLTKVQLDQHRQRFHPEIEYRHPCQLCSHTFKKRSAMYLHIRDAHIGNINETVNETKAANVAERAPRQRKPKKKFTKKTLLCDICPSTFTNTSEINNHMRKVHGAEGDISTQFDTKITEGDITTQFDTKITEDGITISNWINKVGARFQCPVKNCGIMFMTEVGLNDHSKLHGTFPCNFCNEAFQFARDLALHELNEHSKNDSNEEKDEEGCPRCSYKIPNIYSSRNSQARYVSHHLHVHLNLLADGLRCPVCKFLLVTHNKHDQSRRMLTHYLAYHDKASVDHDDGKLHSCLEPGCTAYFLTPSQLEEHRLRFHVVGENKHACRHCDSKFKRRGYLSAHLRTMHQEILEVPCKIAECSKKFDTQLDLNRHMRLMHPVNKPECRQCEKKFGRLQLLAQHLRVYKVNSLLDTLVCDLCGKRFKSGELLEEHLKNEHKDRKSYRFSCTSCSRKFRRRSHLEQHEEIHSKEKFTCDTCAVAFLTKCGLLYHMETKHKEITTKREYVCQVCQAKFNLKKNLHAHTRRKHGNVDT